MIVTDHHELHGSLPCADAVINPKQPDCSFPDKNIAGVAISFYLAAALRSYLTERGYFSNSSRVPIMKDFLELVAIGTIADMVPLTAVNRTLVRAGFEVIDAAPSVGVKALLQESEIVSGNISSEDIAVSYCA